ncbi:MAG TPA: VWA domain-containing protein [Vicinamibacterales bacterium]|nr:VWA domain-containing protein [Vicinamibacterales bacterium]
MTNRRLTAIAVFAVLAANAVAASPQAGQGRVFRATTVSVAVNVSVKRGNNVVTNLTANDFRLTDNGVPQTIDSVSRESVLVDVTLFLDTSGSTAGKLDDMKADVQGIVRLLRPGDRFRLLTIGDSVYENVPWVPAGTKLDLSFGAVGGISLIQDALVMALFHRPDPDRRHLVVGLTDRRDCGSVVSSAFLRELASRSEAVLHLIDHSGSGGDSSYRVRSCSPRGRPDGDRLLVDAATRTGGALHTQSFFFRGSSLLRAFRTIFDEFRQSYVLRYSPKGVEPGGWHAIGVDVPTIKNVTIRARQGYHGK